MKDFKAFLEEKEALYLRKMTQSILLYILIPVFLQAAILTDPYQIGYEDYWIWLRAGIIPIGLISIIINKLDLIDDQPEIPIAIPLGYVGTILIFLISKSGYQDSNYFHAFLQLIVGMSLLPFRPSYYLTLLGAFLIGLIWTILSGAGIDFSTLASSQITYLKTWPIVSIFIFWMSRKVRRSLYLEQQDMNDELVKKNQSLKETALQLVKARKSEVLGKEVPTIMHDVAKPFAQIKMIFEELEQITTIERLKFLLPTLKRRLDSSFKLALATINDVSVYSKKVPDKDLTSMTDVILDSIQDSAAFLDFPDVKLVLKKGHHFSLCADGNQLTRAISNILTNAVQATGEGGKVWVETKSFNDTFEVTIGNSNSYISPENIDKIFETGTSLGKRNGTGIGLAVAKKVVEDHDGKIEVFSDPQKLQVEMKIRLPETISYSDAVDFGEFKNLKEIKGARI